jgi:protein TonB
MSGFQVRVPDRIKSAIGVAVFHALLGYVLVTGLSLKIAADARTGLKLFDVPPPPPPPPPEETGTSEAEEGAAAPPNLKARPVPVVAPPPEVRLEVPPPLPAAPAAADGIETTSGATDRPGPGTGAGGEGTGTGSGGSGIGGGSGSGIATRARLIRGRLRDSDYPRTARRGAWDTVSVRFTVAPNGRVAGCDVTKTSGNATVDAAACRLIQRRFRYEPARDLRGRPVSDMVVGTQIWGFQGRR